MALAIGLSACGGDVPPLADLALRDALLASPETIASLPASDRALLAERFRDAQDQPELDALLPWSGVTSPALQLEEVDGWRLERELDSVVLGRLQEEPEGFLRLQELSEAAVSADGSEAIELAGLPGETTAALERMALESEAGALLTALGERFAAPHRVRVTSWPAAVLVRGESVYVNAAWLVALSPVPDEPLVPVDTPPSPAHEREPHPSSPAPAAVPLGLDYNPYKLPGSLAACEQSVISECDCITSGGCANEDPIYGDFGTAAEECAWVANGDGRAAALCVLALSSIDAISNCLRNQPDCPTHSLDAALTFTTRAHCVELLDSCLAHGGSDAPDDGGGSVCDENDDGCWDACDDDCQACEDRCADRCNVCNDKGEHGKSDGEAAGCWLAASNRLPRRVVDRLWLLAPLLLLLAISRRAR